MRQLWALLAHICLSMPQSLFAKESEETMTPFVSTQWLADHLDDPDLLVIDASVLFNDPDGEFLASGLEDYQKEHIPGAVFADQFQLAKEDAPIPFTAIDHDVFVAYMESLGMTNESRVVVYDGGPEVAAEFKADSWASRLAWQLQYEGKDQVAVLEGGLAKWKADGYKVTDEETSISPGQLDLTRQEALYTDLEGMKALVDQEDPQTVLIDALSPDQFSGAFASFGDDRNGHIPGAFNVPYMKLEDPETGELLAADQLKEIFAESDALNPDKEVVVYCGFGVAASYVRNVLNQLGQDQVKVYDGSLMEWATQSDYPLEATEDPQNTQE